jgi:hypothetical protein
MKNERANLNRPLAWVSMILYPLIKSLNASVIGRINLKQLANFRPLF